MDEIADVFAGLDGPRAVNARRHSLHDILATGKVTATRQKDGATSQEARYCLLNQA